MPAVTRLSIALVWVLSAAGCAGQLDGKTPQVVPPETKREAPADFAVVVGVEEYPHIANADYAAADAKLFRDLLRDTVGVPENRIVLLINADANKGSVVDALSRGREAVAEGGTLWLFFSGHGALSSQKEVFLIGPAFNGKDAQLPHTSIRRDAFYADSKPGTRTVVILDACFSGSGRDGAELYEGAKFTGVVPEDMPLYPGENVAVWSAGGATEVAWGLATRKLGRFTYLVTAALSGWARAPNGAVTLGAAADRVAEGIQEIGEDDDGKMQTPQLLPKSARAWVLTEATPALTGLQLSRRRRAKEAHRTNTRFTERTGQRWTQLEPEVRRLMSSDRGEALRLVDDYLETDVPKGASLPFQEDAEALRSELGSLRLRIGASEGVILWGASDAPDHRTDVAGLVGLLFRVHPVVTLEADLTLGLEGSWQTRVEAGARIYPGQRYFFMRLGLFMMVHPVIDGVPQGGGIWRIGGDIPIAGRWGLDFAIGPTFWFRGLIVFEGQLAVTYAF